MENKKTKVALILGGTSPERPVSKESAKSILAALRNLDYDVKLVDPAYGIHQPENEEDYFTENDFTEIKNSNYVEAVNSSLFDNIDIAFNGLHGKWGEDGTIQSLLELRGIKYTGAGILASALAMDKANTKIMFAHFDVKTPRWFLVNKNDVNLKLIQDKIKKFFGYPCIVKPNDQGSTFGFSICRGDSEVEKALNLGFQFSDKLLVEEHINGREMTVGILDQKPLSVLEIVPKHKVYDYECKYTDGMSEYIVPAQIPKEVFNHMKHQALLAYNSVGCTNYGRVDFLLDKNNNTYCLEVNTLPGMTSHSLMPKMAKNDGISFEELIDRIIKYAI